MRISLQHIRLSRALFADEILLKIGRLVGFVPIGLGITCLAGYYSFENVWFAIVGLLLIIVAIPANMFLLICVGVNIVVANRNWDRVKVFIILLANYPIAYVCFWGGYSISSKVYVEMTNLLKNPIYEVRAIDPSGKEFEFPAIEAGKRKGVTYYRMRGAGGIMVEFKSGGISFQMEPQGYISNLRGGKIELVIDDKFIKKHRNSGTVFHGSRIRPEGP